jgi:hypothetical protein
MYLTTIWQTTVHEDQGATIFCITAIFCPRVNLYYNNCILSGVNVLSENSWFGYSGLDWILEDNTIF